MPQTPSLEDRFHGCLLGLAVGDALGGYVEGWDAEAIRRRYDSPQDLIDHPPANELWYTDDTQMTLGVAETLIKCSEIENEELCRRFVANYVPHRGYGHGARMVLDAMEEGEDHEFLAETYFPGGSFGNGAAMRVAPVGLMFRHQSDELWEQARRSALPTHRHPLGIEGAQLLALAVSLASLATEDPAQFERVKFCETLTHRATFAEYSGPLRRVAALTNVEDLGLFGNGIAAPDSVVTAIACFVLTPDSYVQTIGNAILLGGDTDTIAAMAGAISGAYLGRSVIPPHLFKALEDGPQGRSYIEQLATQLHAAHLAIAGG